MFYNRLKTFPCYLLPWINNKLNLVYYFSSFTEVYFSNKIVITFFLCVDVYHMMFYICVYIFTYHYYNKMNSPVHHIIQFVCVCVRLASSDHSMWKPQEYLRNTCMYIHTQIQICACVFICFWPWPSSHPKGRINVATLD